MVDLVNQRILPSAIESELDSVNDLQSSVAQLQKCLLGLQDRTDLKQTALFAQRVRLEIMEKTRALCDEVEALCAVDVWSLCPYRKLIFLDQCYDHKFKKITAQ